MVALNRRAAIAASALTTLKRSRFASGTFLAVILTLFVASSTVQLCAQGGAWGTETPMPTVRHSLGTSVVNSILYAVGGCNYAVGLQGACRDLTTVEAYDPVSNTWTPKQSMPTARRGLGTSVMNGVIYAMGGITSGYLATVEAYDPVSNTWTPKQSMPTARAAYGIGVVNGIIYAVGGFGNGNVFVTTVDAYDPSSDTWTTKAASLPIPTGYTSASVVDGVLYVVGGATAGGVSGVVEAYDPASDTWTIKASMPTPRFGLATSVVNDVIYAVGGQSAVGGILGTVEAYDPASDTWATTIAPMPTPRLYPSASTTNGILYAVGGFTPISVVGTVEAFMPMPVPTNADQCKKGGWMMVFQADGSPFKNQGDCIQYINTGK